MPNQGINGFPVKEAIWNSGLKYTKLRNTGNKTTTSTSFVAIDGTNLPPVAMILAVGDVVRCLLQSGASAGSGGVFFDFEVVPPSGTATRVCAPAANGVAMLSSTARNVINVEAVYVASEGGRHTFQPIWAVTGGTAASIPNATSANDDQTILFLLQNLRRVTPDA